VESSLGPHGHPDGPSIVKGGVVPAYRAHHDNGNRNAESCDSVPSEGMRMLAEHETARLVPVGPIRILRIRAVCERTGLSPSSIWRGTRRGEFPAARRWGSKSVGWLSSEVDAWIASRPLSSGPSSHEVMA
jgi:prophage regulatory protein